MLDFLRKRKRSWIITFLLGLIIVVFIAFYGGSKYGDGGSPDVAEVNGEVISQRDFAVQYERALDRYRELLKGSLTPEMLKSLNIKRTLLDELIQKRLLLQEARGLGLTVTGDELAKVLSTAPEFQVAGRFNKERYVQLLRINKLTPAEFEDEQRDQLMIQRLYGIILDSVQVSEAEVRDRYRPPPRRGPVSWTAAPSPVPTRPAPSEIGALPPVPTRDAMAPPDGAAVSDNAMGLTQRELLMEMREDIKGLKATVDAIARDQAGGGERRAAVPGDVGGEVRKTGRGERI